VKLYKKTLSPEASSFPTHVFAVLLFAQSFVYFVHSLSVILPHSNSNNVQQTPIQLGFLSRYIPPLLANQDYPSTKRQCLVPQSSNSTPSPASKISSNIDFAQLRPILELIVTIKGPHNPLLPFLSTSVLRCLVSLFLVSSEPFLIWLETDWSPLLELYPQPSVTIVSTVDEERKETSLRWTIVDVQHERFFKTLYPLHAEIDRRTGVNTFKWTKMDKLKVHPPPRRRICPILPAIPVEMSLPVATPAPGIAGVCAFLGLRIRLFNSVSLSCD